jgi:Tfp pilus assembly protein PilO
MVKFNLQQLDAVFTRLSKRERQGAILAVFFVTLILLDRGIINPIMSKMSSLNKEIQEEMANIKKDLRLVAQKDNIRLEAGKYDTYVTVSKTEEEEITFVLKAIEDLANKSSVYLVDMKPAGMKETATTKKYFINLDVEGQMEQLTDFMYGVESSSRFLIIEKYQIEPKSKDSSVAKCSMIISKVVLP